LKLNNSSIYLLAIDSSCSDYDAQARYFLGLQPKIGEGPMVDIFEIPDLPIMFDL